MKAFADLYAALDETTRTTDKVAAMARYFAAAPPADAAWAVYFLSGRKPRQAVPSKRLRLWARELAAVPEWLFDLINPWTTPATLLVAVTAVAWLAGQRGRRLATVAAVTAAGLGLWQAWRIGPPSGLLDLQIYVGSARGWLDGGSLYDFRDSVHHLGATYPPIGPILFSVLGPLPVEAREVLWTAASLAALAVTLPVTLLRGGSPTIPAVLLAVATATQNWMMPRGRDGADDMAVVVRDLGRATAKVHCASDEDSEQNLVTFQTEEAICGVLEGRRREFVADLTDFAVSYADRVRTDHSLFVDAFREGRIGGVSAT